MKTRLGLIAILCSPIAVAVSVAVTYNLMTLWSAALISLLGFVAVCAAFYRRPNVDAQNVWGSQRKVIVRVIWVYVIAACIGVLGIGQHTWREVCIGVPISFLLIMAYLAVLDRGKAKRPPDGT